MIFSPARCFFPKTQAALANLRARGGTLARLPQIRPGHFPYPSRSSPVAPCSVILTRDARSPRAGVSSVHEGANRAACMGEGEAFSGPLPSPLLGFHQAAHKLRTDHTNRNQALPFSGLGRGAAGHVQRISPRLSIPVQINHSTHEAPPNNKVQAIGTAFRGGGNIIRRRRNGQDF